MPDSSANRFAELTRNFEPEEVKSRRLRRNSDDTVDYISIDTVLKRLNDVLGTDWSTSREHIEVYPPREGEDNWTVLIGLNMHALDKTAYGVGAGIDRELDNAAKTALAEAIKKCGHQFGIGMELWDEEFRALVSEARESKVTVRGRSRVR